MGSPPDIFIGVFIEVFEGSLDLKLHVRGAAITQIMKDLHSNLVVLVINHFAESLPELVDVSLHSAGAELLDGLQSNLRIFVVGYFEDGVDVFSVLNSSQEVFFLLVGGYFYLG